MDHSKYCEVLEFARNLAAKYEKIHMSPLLRAEIISHLNLEPKVFLGDNNMTFTIRDLTQPSSAITRAIATKALHSGKECIERDSSDEEDQTEILSGPRKRSSDKMPPQKRLKQQ